MGQSLQHTVHAQRVAAYYHQAKSCHQVVRWLVTGAVELDTPGDGTITVRVPYAEWRAVCDEATRTPPEPLDPAQG